MAISPGLGVAVDCDCDEVGEVGEGEGVIEAVIVAGGEEVTKKDFKLDDVEEVEEV